MNSTFGMFYYAMLASYLTFVEWPERPLEIRYDRSRGALAATQRFLSWFDTYGQLTWTPFELKQKGTITSGPQAKGCLVLLDRNRTFRGFEAFKGMVLWNPLAYFGYAILLGRQPRGFQYHRWLAAIVLLVFAPFLGSVVKACSEWIAHLWQLFSAGR